MPDASAAPSPCTGVCELDRESGLCAGCLRTMDEIVRWARLSDEERRAVLRDLLRRRSAVPGRSR